MEVEYQRWPGNVCKSLGTSRKGQGVVCLVHGVGEHIGRYQADGKRCQVQAISWQVLTSVASEDPMDSAPYPNLEAYFDDIDLFLAEVTRRYPDQPRFLYGHSMGAILVLAYTSVRQPPLAGVIATAPD